MSSTNFSAILAQFGDSIGIEGLAPDESGMTALFIDDLQIILNWQEDDDLLTVRALIGDIAPQSDVLRLYSELLSANSLCCGTGGLLLGIEPVFDQIVLSGRLPGRDMSPVLLHRFIEFFLDMAEQWQEKIKALQADDAVIDESGTRPGAEGIRI
ncbi:type III secretion system chaperone [Desulfovibrio sp. OttesenSCG-928-G11]|nr:type III secretion system chaperone [Desulfovibrio sp. OttesenSCG-928-G11]